MIVFEYINTFYPVYILCFLVLYIFYKAAGHALKKSKQTYHLFKIRDPLWFRSFLRGYLNFFITVLLGLLSVLLLATSVSSLFFKPNISAERETFSIHREKEGYYIDMDGERLFLGRSEQSIRLIALSVVPRIKIFNTEGLSRFYGISSQRMSKTRVFSNKDIIAEDYDFIAQSRWMSYLKYAYRYSGCSAEYTESPSFPVRQGNYYYRLTKHGYIFIGG